MVMCELIGILSSLNKLKKKRLEILEIQKCRVFVAAGCDIRFRIRILQRDCSTSSLIDSKFMI